MAEYMKLLFRRFLDSLKLTQTHLIEFGDIWVEIFLWCFITSICAHFIASIVAIISLRSHKIGRWYAVLILLAGIITPIVPSTLTSALLSAIFYAASVDIKPFFCVLLGVGQTGVILFFSFMKILSTL